MGQVVGTYGQDAYYFAVFHPVVRHDEVPTRVEEVLSGPVHLLALSFDAKLYHGDWQVVGNRPVRGDVPLPAYQEVVGTPDRVDVVDYSGTRRRRASPQEELRLSNRKLVAPVRLERY